MITVLLPYFMLSLRKFSALLYVSIFRWLVRRRPVQARPIKLDQKSRVLLFTCAGIGDTLTDSVVAKALWETFPGLEIGAVVHRRRELLVRHNPYIRHVFLFHKGPWAFLRLLWQLKSAGPWHAILHLRGNDPEPRCLSFLVDAGVSVSSPDMTRLQELCGHTVEQLDWDQTHGVEQTLRLARAVQADTLEPHLVYSVQPHDRTELENKLGRLFPDLCLETPRLVLQLGGGRRASWRDWPISRVAELVGELAGEKNRGCEIFVLGGADQLPRARALAALVEPSYREVIGKLSLAESAALLESARALISTDTGIMHLGFAVGTRVVALIHCHNPSHRVGPYGYGDRHRVLALPRPSGYRTPADASMGDLTPQMVLKALAEFGIKA